MSTTIREDIEKTARGEMPYPVLARRLREAGFRRYEVDVATREAILANQRKEIDYDKFLERIWRSGVTRYDVDLEARTITDRGQEGEAYEERIPDVD